MQKKTQQQIGSFKNLPQFPDQHILSHSTSRIFEASRDKRHRKKILKKTALYWCRWNLTPPLRQLTQQYWLPPFFLLSVCSRWMQCLYVSLQGEGDGAISNDSENTLLFCTYSYSIGRGNHVCTVSFVLG